jgi:hypothetical protein
MTRGRAKELLPIIEAFTNGKEIEVSEDGENWYEEICPNFTNSLNYRIKPEPEYVPFTFEDAKKLIGKGVEDKDHKLSFIILMADKNRVFNYHGGITYEALLGYCTFLDGSPCGKLKS